MSEPTFAFGELLKLLVALGVTIGLFYALALFMKRLQVGTGKSGSLITVLAAMPLGGKEKLWVVDVAGEKLVIGTAPGNVNCLHVLNGASATDAAEKTLGPRMREGDAVQASPPSEATPSSFPRMRESSVVVTDAEKMPGPRMREGDPVQASPQAFADLLTKFRGWQK